MYMEQRSRKEKERDVSSPLEIKTLLTTMVALGLFLLSAQTFYKFSRPSSCSLPEQLFTASSVPKISASISLQKQSYRSRPGTTLSVPSAKMIEKQNQSLAVDSFKEKRQFRAFGTAAHLFIEYGTYRGGSQTFAIVGLASKPLHVFGKPGFECEWIPSKGSTMTSSVMGKAKKFLPDWGYGRVYTVVVVNCTFDEPVGADAKGGQLILHATHGDGYGKSERIETLTEKEGDYNASKFDAPYPYDFVYCGSSLFGKLNPQRIREWMAYHVRLFGPRSHFVFHDAGGVHSGVMKVLKPWIKAGYATVENIRQQEQFDGYYYNQFLIVNDCLHKTRFMSKWTFFFDVDEYLYVPPQDKLGYIMEGFSDFTQITYEQSPMSNKICLYRKAGDYSRQWGFEKLVFRSVKKRTWIDRKYAIQARNVYATGIHMSESKHMIGKTLHTKGPKIKYYHYHNTINNVGEVCQVFMNSTTKDTAITYEKEPYKLDTGMQYFAEDVKKFEMDEIGRSQSVIP